MRIFLEPVIRFMDSKKFPMKLSIIGIIATVAVATLSIQLVVQSLDIMASSKNELIGVNVISPLFNIMRDIQLYRNVEDEFFTGNPNLKDKLLAMQDTIDQAINTMNSKEGAMISSLGITEDWNSVKTEWQLIKSNLLIDDTKSNVGIETQLISNIQNLIIEACDNSNLTLDPNIETYYLMDSACTKIPFFTEKLSQIRNLGMQALMTQKLSTDDRQQLATDRTLVNVYIKPAIKANFDKVSSTIENTTSTPSEFRPYIETLYTQTGDLMNALGTTILSSQFTEQPDHFSEEYLTLLSLTYKLNILTEQKLYHLIHQRVQRITNHLYINITISIISLLALIYLFFGIYFSVIHSIKKLVQGSDKLSKGEFNARVELSTKDELVQVASSFNAMLDSISKIDGEISRTLASALKGDLSNRITGSYHGSFEKLKNYVNDTLDHINKLSKKLKIPAEIINGSIKKFSADKELKKHLDRQTLLLNKITNHAEEIDSCVHQHDATAKQINKIISTAMRLMEQGDLLTQQANEKLSGLSETIHKISDRITVGNSPAEKTVNELKELLHHAANELVFTSQKINELIQHHREQLASTKQIENIFPEAERHIAEQIHHVDKLLQELNDTNALADKDTALLDEVMTLVQAIETQAEKMNAIIRNFSEE